MKRSQLPHPGSVEDCPATVAFTLIELLVVIAIIAILAGLFLPSLTRAKSLARIVRCKSNVHQLSLGLILYVEDHGVYPRPLTSLYKTFQTTNDWAEALMPYTRSPWTNDLYRCPDYRGPTAFPKFDQWGNPAGASVPGFNMGSTLFGAYRLGSYGYNGWDDRWPNNLDLGNVYTSMPGKGYIYRQVREAEVRVPSDMVALGDATLVQIDWPAGTEKAYGYISPIPKPVGKPPTIVAGTGLLSKRPFIPSAHLLGVGPSDPRLPAARKVIRVRHDDRYNVAFCDGHIELLKHDKLFEFSDTALRHWVRTHEPSP